MRADPLDRFVNGPGLRGIVEQPHDRSWLCYLCDITQEDEVKGQRSRLTLSSKKCSSTSNAKANSGNRRLPNAIAAWLW